MLSKTAGACFVALTLPLIPCQSAADVMWTYNTDIDKTPHFLRVNRISETSSPAQKVQGIEIDGRYAMSDSLGIVARYSFGSGDAVEDGETSESKLKIVDIGMTYGVPINDHLFYELKAVYNYYQQRSFSENEGATEKENLRSIRLTPRVRFDINSYLQARALIEIEKPEHEDLGSETAIYLTLTPINKLALDFKFGKGLTTTDHNDPEQGKWSNDAWYFEPRISYRINSTVSIEASYRDKKEGGRLVDFGAVAFF